MGCMIKLSFDRVLSVLLLFIPISIVLEFIHANGVLIFISADGESNWLEGVQLIALYAMMAVVFFLIK